MTTRKTTEQKRQTLEIQQKQLDENVSKALQFVVTRIVGRNPVVRPQFFRSPSATHPKHLVINYIFCTDADRAIANGNGLAHDIKSFTREALVKVGYSPKEAAQVSVHFTSDEHIYGKAQ